MTLGDLERPSTAILRILALLVGLHTLATWKRLQLDPYYLQAECSPQNVVSGVYSLWGYSVEFAEYRRQTLVVKQIRVSKQIIASHRVIMIHSETRRRSESAYIRHVNF